MITLVCTARRRTLIQFTQIMGGSMWERYKCTCTHFLFCPPCRFGVVVVKKGCVVVAVDTTGLQNSSPHESGQQPSPDPQSRSLLHLGRVVSDWGHVLDGGTRGQSKFRQRVPPHSTGQHVLPKSQPWSNLHSNGGSLRLQSTVWSTAGQVASVCWQVLGLP